MSVASESAGGNSEACELLLTLHHLPLRGCARADPSKDAAGELVC